VYATALIVSVDLIETKSLPGSNPLPRVVGSSSHEVINSEAVRKKRANTEEKIFCKKESGLYGNL
jgi:hypothetical protein